MSVGATWSLRSTTNLANCLTLIMYLGSSVSALMIFVQRATCSGCSPEQHNIFPLIQNEQQLSTFMCPCSVSHFLLHFPSLGHLSSERLSDLYTRECLPRQPQVMLNKLLVHCVLRQTQPPTHNRTETR